MSWSPEVPYQDLPSLPPKGVELESKRVLKAVTEARAEVARLDQATALMPNPLALVNTIPLLEAQASSEIENIVTTTDALFQAASLDEATSIDPAVKETLRYRTALRSGFESMQSRSLSAGTAVEICSGIIGIEMGLRSLPGTRIANPLTEEIVYSPPEGQGIIAEKLSDWEKFIHADDELDPIVKMAVAHYQFEAIHPFADGNGRTGRILNILMLNYFGLLQAPILYLSRCILKNKNDYYRLLGEVTSAGSWEEWVLFMAEAVRRSAQSTTKKILAIHDLQETFRTQYYDLSNGLRDANFLAVLFTQPYVRIANVVQACHVSRQTASIWLDGLVRSGVLSDLRLGRDRLFVNTRYLNVLSRSEDIGTDSVR